MENKPLTEIMKEYGPSNNYSGQIVDEEFLAHYGVLGMHWGVRRFQPYSLIPRKSGKGGKEMGEAKKTSKSSSDSSSSSSSRMSRNQKSQVAKEEIEKKTLTARQRREALEKIINSGSAKEVYEHRGELTEQQMRNAISRINTEAQLAALVKQQNPTNLDKLKKLAGEVKDINNVVRTGVDSYNIASNIKDIAKKNTKAKKEEAFNEASAETLKKIIESGNKDVDIKALQSKLSKQDLQTAVQRLASINAAETSIRNNAQTERQKRIDDYDYLKKSLADIEKGRKTVDSWTEGDMKPSVEPTKSDTNNSSNGHGIKTQKWQINNDQYNKMADPKEVERLLKKVEYKDKSLSKPKGTLSKSKSNNNTEIDWDEFYKGYDKPMMSEKERENLLKDANRKLGKVAKPIKTVKRKKKINV